MYDLIIGKQTLHDIGTVLDFKDRSITIDNILLPMKNIANLQLNSSITRALRQNSARNACLAQEPVSTKDGTNRVIAILDAKYDKADLPAIIGDYRSHLTPSLKEKLPSLLLKYEKLFDGTLGNWNRPPVSIEMKEGAKPYHGRPYPIAQIHKSTLMKEISRLVKNPPPAPGSLFLGIAIRSVSGRDLTRVPKPNSISGKPTSGQQPAIFKKQFGGSNCLPYRHFHFATPFLAGTIRVFKN